MADFEIDRRLMGGARRILASKLALIANMPSGYIHDPALVILLTLYLHRSDQPMTHSAVCNAVEHVPFSVSTRWIRAIEGDGLIVSKDVPMGGDPLVSLTSRGLAAIKDAIMAVDEAEKRVRDEAEGAFAASKPAAASTSC